MLPKGVYHTAAGSTLKVSGKFGGIAEVSFDWLEEGGCCDCVAEAYPSEDGDLVWHCEQHESGRAKWLPGEKPS